MYIVFPTIVLEDKAMSWWDNLSGSTRRGTICPARKGGMDSLSLLSSAINIIKSILCFSFSPFTFISVCCIVKMKAHPDKSPLLMVDFGNSKNYLERGYGSLRMDEMNTNGIS